MDRTQLGNVCEEQFVTMYNKAILSNSAMVDSAIRMINRIPVQKYRVISIEKEMKCYSRFVLYNR
jgi:hypothetical protein